MYYKYVKATRYHADLIVSGDAEVSAIADQVMKVLSSQQIVI